MSTNPYTSSFYATYIEESRGSARQLLPEVVRMFKPASVVDIGCGVGAWISVFPELGVTDILGVDGDYVDRSQLLIPPARFQSHDLSTPLRLARRFDLAMSLEVAEHISHANAQTFVDTLVGLAPLVLFSAAAPFQGGDHHVNEQWPEYWVERFGQRDYLAFDCVRPMIWDNPAVAYYYAQNAFVFVAKAAVGNYPVLSSVQPASTGLSKIHPRRWLEANDARRQHLKPLLKALPHSISNAVGVRLRRVFRAAR